MSVPMRKSRVPPPPTDCELSHCMRVIGGTWKPQVIWYLGDMPRRFGELRRDLAGISAKVLTTNLLELEREGVITRRDMPTSPPTVEYALTDLGRELHPLIVGIVHAGNRFKRARLASEAMSIAAR